MSKPTLLIIGMIAFVSIPLYSQSGKTGRLVLEDAITLTDSYYKDFDQYDDEQIFLKELNGQLEILKEIFYSYTSKSKMDSNCTCYTIDLNVKDSVNDKLSQHLDQYWKSLKKNETLLSKYSNKLETYQTNTTKFNITISQGSQVPDYLKLDSVAENRNRIDGLRVNKLELEIRRNFCYLEYYKRNTAHDGLKDDFAKIISRYLDLYNHGTSFTKKISTYTEKSLFSMNGSAIFTTIIDGLAGFIIDRAKKEAVITATNHYQRLINKVDPAYIKTIEATFPNTVKTLSNFESADITRYPQHIKNAIEEDFKNLPTNLYNAIEKRIIPVDDQIRSAVILFKSLSDSHTPQDFIRTLSKQTLIKNDTIKDFFTELNIASEILLIRKPNGIVSYASPSYLNNYWKDTLFKSCYTNLFDYNYSEMQKEVNSTFKITKGNIDTLLDVVPAFYKVVEMSQELITDKKKSDTVYYARISRLYTATLDLVTVFNNTFTKNDTIKQKVKKVIKNAELVGDIYRNIYRKKYINVVNNVLDLLLQMDNTDLDSAIVIMHQQCKEKKTYDELRTKLEQENLCHGIIALIIHQNNKAAKVDSVAFMNKYSHELGEIRMINELLSFLASVASIENGQDVKKVFEDYAMPVGSYTVKRNNIFSITFDAQPGFFAGVQGGDNNKPTFAWGGTVPIGISFSWGINSRMAKITSASSFRDGRYEKHSISLFVSFMDLAAPVSFRLRNNQDSTNSTLPMLDPINLFSPGAYFTYGIPNAPINLIAGFQYNPQVMRFDPATNLPIQSSTGLRGCIGLTFDIPIFKIYAVRRYK